MQVPKSHNYDPSAIDNYNYQYDSNKPEQDKEYGFFVEKLSALKHWFRHFLWFCAGADIQILDRCPHSDRVKAEGIGGVVLATAVLAFFSGSYAFYTVFGPKVGPALAAEQQLLGGIAFFASIMFGVLWALIIFNLDRFVVSSSGHGDGTEAITLGELMQATPRILMALLIGFTLSKPLEIRILEPEINAALDIKQQDQVKVASKGAEVKYKFKREQLQKDIDEARSKNIRDEEVIVKLNSAIQEGNNQLAGEIQGNIGSGKAGLGPAANAIQSGVDTNKTLLATAQQQLAINKPIRIQEITTKEQELKDADAEFEEVRKRHEVQANNMGGLWMRIDIAHTIAPTMTWTLTALLLLIETAPIFFKMMMARGAYELLKENQKLIVIAKNGIEIDTILSRPYHEDEIRQLKSHWRYQLNRMLSFNRDQLEFTEKIVGRESFHQADTIIAYQKGQFKVEQHLTGIAQSAYQDRVATDIQVNPEKYVVKPEQKT